LLGSKGINQDSVIADNTGKQSCWSVQMKHFIQDWGYKVKPQYNYHQRDFKNENITMEINFVF